MYKVTIETIEKKNKEVKTFMVSDGDSFNQEMNALSDYLYDLDIPFDVDEDGDMLLDDILVAVSDGEPFEQELKTKKVVFRFKGEEA